MDKFSKLKLWLNMQNDNLSMYDKGSRGIYSIKDIKDGEVILQIPSKYIIEYSKVSNNSISSKLNNSNSLIALYLLLKSQKKSFWTPYLDSLPESVDEYIFFYDKEKLSQLKDTSLMFKDSFNYNDHLKNIISDSKIIHEWLLKKNLLKNESLKIYKNFFKLFLKYRILVCSRIFGYTKNNEDETGLVPYADLFNHSQKSNTTWYFDDSLDSFILRATETIKKNSEIYDSYGEKTNDELLLYYGFTIKNNKNSRLYIKDSSNVIQLDYSTKLTDIIHKESKKEKIIKKLKSILESHQHKLKENKIVDNNILNIYNDEICIIKKILK
jgi:hypothetical protein